MSQTAIVKRGEVQIGSLHGRQQLHGAIEFDQGRREPPQAPFAIPDVLQSHSGAVGIAKTLEGLLCAKEIRNSLVESGFVCVRQPDVVDLQRLVIRFVTRGVQFRDSRKQRPGARELHARRPRCCSCLLWVCGTRGQFDPRGRLDRLSTRPSVSVVAGCKGGCCPCAPVSTGTPILQPVVRHCGEIQLQQSPRIGVGRTE